MICTHNTVHRLFRTTADGFDSTVLNLNWRYWGIAISWGDTILTKFGPMPEQMIIQETEAVWFIGVHVGPVFILKHWKKG